MASDVFSEGMKLVRYLDLYPWTKDPDELVLLRRSDVTEPKPGDCFRVRVEIKLPKSFWLGMDGSDRAVKAEVRESEVHDGVAGRPEDVDAPEPLKAQG